MIFVALYILSPLSALAEPPENAKIPSEVDLLTKLPVVIINSQPLGVQIPIIPKVYHVNYVATSTSPELLSEDVPRSLIGEVPEVHFARQAHLRAVLALRNRTIPIL